jgi:hypothetical protein
MDNANTEISLTELQNILDLNHNKESLNHAFNLNKENQALKELINLDQLQILSNSVKEFNNFDLKIKMQKLNNFMIDINNAINDLGLNDIENKQIKNLFANLENKPTTELIKDVEKVFLKIKLKGKYEKITNLIHILEKRLKYNSVKLKMVKRKNKLEISKPYEFQRIILTGNPKSPEQKVINKISNKAKILHNGLNFASKTSKIQQESFILDIQKRKNQIENLKIKVLNYSKDIKTATELKNKNLAIKNLKNILTKLIKLSYGVKIPKAKKNQTEKTKYYNLLKNNIVAQISY